MAKRQPKYVNTVYRRINRKCILLYYCEISRNIIIIIIIFIYCNWVVTRWQWLFYMYTKHEIGYH